MYMGKLEARIDKIKIGIQSLQAASLVALTMAAMNIEYDLRQMHHVGRQTRRFYDILVDGKIMENAHNALFNAYLYGLARGDELYELFQKFF